MNERRRRRAVGGAWAAALVISLWPDCVAASQPRPKPSDTVTQPTPTAARKPPKVIDAPATGGAPVAGSGAHEPSPAVHPVKAEPDGPPMPSATRASRPPAGTASSSPGRSASSPTVSEVVRRIGQILSDGPPAASQSATSHGGRSRKAPARSGHNEVARSAVIPGSRPGAGVVLTWDRALTARPSPGVGLVWEKDLDPRRRQAPGFRLVWTAGDETSRKDP